MINITTVDSFTKTPFQGNPAAVCILTDEIFSDKTMQLIAREMNLSETAFAKQSKDKKNEFHLRWFTPSVEVPLCGHATLATAHVLFENYEKLLGGNEEIHFTTNVSGVLKVKRSKNGGLQMDFPQASPVKVELKKEVLEQLSKLMNFDFDSVEEVYACGTTRKLLIRVNSIDQIKKLSPDFQSLVKVNFGIEQTIKGIIVTTKGHGEYDFISRYFAPWVSIPEDPVTGSAHTVLGPYWSQKLNKKQMNGFQASERGGSMIVELIDNNRIILEGNAVTVMSGNLYVHKE